MALGTWQRWQDDALREFDAISSGLSSAATTNGQGKALTRAAHFRVHRPCEQPASLRGVFSGLVPLAARNRSADADATVAKEPRGKRFPKSTKKLTQALARDQ